MQNIQKIEMNRSMENRIQGTVDFFDDQEPPNVGINCTDLKTQERSRFSENLWERYLVIQY